MNGLIEYFVRQKLLGNLITVFVVAVGLASTLLIRREVFPNVNFDILTVTTLYPGASAEEVEKLITNPIEQDLGEVEGIKKLRSISIENMSEIIIQLDPDQVKEAEAKVDVQDVVDLFEKPDDAESPKVRAIKSSNTPIIEVSLQSDIDPLELRSVAREYEKKLEKLPGVARVVPKGIRDLEIHIETDPKKLAANRLSLDEVVQALKLQNLSIPGGTMEAKKDDLAYPEKIVRTIGEFQGLEDIRKTVIRTNEVGKPIRVSDVATVKYALKRAEITNRTNGSPSISLTVLKKEKADAIKLVQQVKALMESRRDALKLQGIKFSYVNDLSEFIERRIGILTGNLWVGLALVLLTLTLILRFRVAMIVSLGIPFSFLGGLIIFYQMGESLNLISLLGFIIVSGMLVDDAIVVTDNIARKMEEGMDPHQAAVKGTQEIWKAVTASVLTTLVAFLPMLFLTGIFGKFVRQIPIGVILALTASLIEAFFILPQHVAHFVRPQDVSSAVGANLKGFAAIGEKFKHSWDHRVTPLYLRWLEKFVLRRWLTLSGAFALFVGTLLFAWIKMNFILFPPDGVETFFVRLQAPTTASLQTTENILRGVEEQILKLPQNELKDVVTTAGIHQNDPNDPNVKRGGHFGQIMVFLHPESGRTRTAQEIIDALKKDIPVPNGVVSMTYERAVSGPPVGKPISIAVRGDEMEDILRAVRDMETAVRKIPGAMDVTNSYYEGKEEVQVVVDPIETRAAQLTVAQVGNTVRGAYDGLLPTSIRLLDDDVKLRVSFTRDARSSQSSIEDILVPNAFGNLIPLASISKIKTSRSVSAFTHEANQREVRVLGEVDTQITSARAISAEISKLFPEFRKHHPKVEFSFGGEEEDTQESLASMVRAFILAAFGILFILILTFGNFLQPLLVLLSIPFGVVGVIWAFYFHGMPLSFMGILGIIALAGVIVNNAIVFIDFVNAGKEAGLDPFQSILKAGGARLRPIFLTTFTTVCGLMPTAYGIGGLDKFVVPIAMSLGWGMVVGSLLTAFVLPAAVLALEDVRTWILRTVGN